MASPVDIVLAALEARDCRPRKAANGWAALCPAHDDRSPSLGVTEADDGRALILCRSGCPTEEIVGRLRLTMADLFPVKYGEIAPPQLTLEATYDYVDENGSQLYQVLRYRPKAFRQRRKVGDRWVWGLGQTRRVLYRLPRVRDAINRGEWIFVVEGEKDVHTLERLGKTATTAPHGANKWRPEYTEMLRGAKIVVISDADEVGRKYALDVCNALDPVAAKEVKLYEVAVGKDISDHIAAGFTLKDLKLFDRAGAQSSEAIIADSGRLWVGTARELAELPAPDRTGELLGPLVYRGHRLMIAAQTGAGKTCLSLGMLAAITKGQNFLDFQGKGGCKAIVLDVEQGRGTIQRRIHEVGLEKSDDVIYVVAPDGMALDADPKVCEQLESLFEKHEPAVVLADPFYKLHRGDANDGRAAVDLMRKFDAWRDRYGFALVLPMHMRKAPIGAKFSIDEIYGSSSYQWGAEIVVGLQRMSNGYSFLHFFKDREGVMEVVGDRWGLTYSHEHGFRRALSDDEKDAAREAIRDLLRASPGLTLDEVRAALGTPYKASKEILGEIASPDTNVGAQKNWRWSLNATLFEPGVSSLIPLSAMR